MFYRSLVVVLSFVLSSFAIAETQEVNNTAYGVVIEQAQPTKLSNGVTVMSGGLWHSNVVDADGTVTSQWCRGSGVATEDGSPGAGGGFCTIIAENGDLLWVWFGGGNWGVINGTGQYEGATGSGTSTPGTPNPDGFAFVNQSSGTLNLK